ncbi:MULTISPECIES: hypothetical protein [Anoxybacillus]|uniref:hypothetical protein n=1 Tax=Anoxybacillus TaxID=150247 RepID=UPI0005A0D212|nr:MULTISPECIES: hypothetical protein [Anoxybacillus]AST06344.1 hypothetical protein AF2641_05410 [Anoxybacillus flavithermus]MBW9219765.1 hypothetical protein [Anoxybacillus sp. ST70]
MKNLVFREDMIPVPILVTLLALIVLGLLVVITAKQLYIIIPVSLFLVVFSSFLLGKVLSVKQ